MIRRKVEGGGLSPGWSPGVCGRPVPSPWPFSDATIGDLEPPENASLTSSPSSQDCRSATLSPWAAWGPSPQEVEACRAEGQESWRASQHHCSCLDPPSSGPAPDLRAAGSGSPSPFRDLIPSVPSNTDL